jgi:hypothetical protein
MSIHRVSASIEQMEFTSNEFNSESLLDAMNFILSNESQAQEQCIVIVTASEIDTTIANKIRQKLQDFHLNRTKDRRNVFCIDVENSINIGLECIGI